VDFAPISDEQLIDGWKCKPISAESFAVNLADRAWVDRQCTVQSLACFKQPVQLTGGLGRIVRVAYAYASGWAGDQSPFRPFYDRAKARGWATSEIDSGHDVMLDRPDAVAALLLGSI
jgi:hypothetical protein